MASEFQIHLEGPDLSPATTSASVLADVLRDIESAVIAQARLGNDQTDDAIVSLIAVNEGSTRLRFQVTSVLATAASSIAFAVQGGDWEGVDRVAHENLYSVAKRCRDRGWTAKWTDDLLGDELGASLQDAPPPPARGETRGPTVVYGQCSRVGGLKTPSVELRFDDGSRRTVHVTREIAKTIGASLYESVGLEGEAVWYTDDWAIKDFKAESITQFQDPSPLSAFRRLAEVAGPFWREVDAAKYVDDLRGWVREGDD